MMLVVLLPLLLAVSVLMILGAGGQYRGEGLEAGDYGE